MAPVSATILDRCVSRRGLTKPFTKFRIQVHCGQQLKVIERRYSEFEALEREMRPSMPSLPKMPPKGIVNRMSSALTDQTDFMDQRQFQLGQLLSAMLVLDPEVRNFALRRFLAIEADWIPRAEIAADRSPKVLRPKWLPNHDAAPICLETPAKRPEWLDDLVPQRTVSFADAQDSVGADAVQEHPDFAGMWNLDQIEGDMESLMTELEVPWLVRKAVAASGYGVRKAKVNVSQHDDLIEVENINPVKCMKRVYCTDGVEHDEVLEGKALKTSCHWEGNTLVSESRNAKTGKAFPKMARYLQQDKMIAEQFLPNGHTVKQIFVKGAELCSSTKDGPAAVESLKVPQSAKA